MPAAGAVGISSSAAETRGVSAPAETSPPDWSVITDTIRCPLCDYDLRGLSEPLCPECGYRFAWDELLDAQLRSHRFLFEHARRRFRISFLKTNLAGWWPWFSGGRSGRSSASSWDF
jgi:hypothetical protein